MLKDFLRLKQGYIILLMQTIVGLFVFSFVPLFLKEKGYSYFFVLFLYALYTGVGVLLIPLFRRFYLKKYLMMGFVCFMILAIIVAFLLRFEGAIPPEYYDRLPYYIFIFAGLNLILSF